MRPHCFWQTRKHAAWDCAPGVDYVTIHTKAIAKLTAVKFATRSTMSFAMSPTLEKLPPWIHDKTAAFLFSPTTRNSWQDDRWAISVREAAEQSDPECFAARAVGPLPPATIPSHRKDQELAGDEKQAHGRWTT